MENVETILQAEPIDRLPRLWLNKAADTTPGNGAALAIERARREITGWPDYAPTPVLARRDLAKVWRLGEVFVKLEESRFGIGSFKPLGPGYGLVCAMRRYLAKQGINASTAELISGRYAPLLSGVTVACASSGNHGRALAWMADHLGMRCVVFLPAGTAQAAKDAIARRKAEIVLVAGDFDAAAAAANTSGHLVISHLRYAEHPDLPSEIMHGYGVIGLELSEQVVPAPTHVFVAGGSGRLAAGVALALAARSTGSRVILVEPSASPGLLASLSAGRRRRIASGPTMMEHLVVGTPSEVALPVLSRQLFGALTITDAEAGGALRLAAGLSPPLEVGVTGVAALAGLMRAAKTARTKLGLSFASRVAVIACEGVSDPAAWQAVVGRSPVEAWL